MIIGKLLNQGQVWALHQKEAAYNWGVGKKDAAYNWAVGKKDAVYNTIAPIVVGNYQQYNQACLHYTGKDGKTVGKIAGLVSVGMMAFGVLYLTPMGYGMDLVGRALPMGYNFVMGCGSVIRMVLELVLNDLIGGVLKVVFVDFAGGIVHVLRECIGVLGDLVGLLGSGVGVILKGAITAGLIFGLVIGYRTYNFFNGRLPAAAVNLLEIPQPPAANAPHGDLATHHQRLGDFRLLLLRRCAALIGNHPEAPQPPAAEAGREAIVTYVGLLQLNVARLESIRTVILARFGAPGNHPANAALPAAPAALAADADAEAIQQYVEALGVYVEGVRAVRTALIAHANGIPDLPALPAADAGADLKEAYIGQVQTYIDQLNAVRVALLARFPAHEAPRAELPQPPPVGADEEAVRAYVEQIRGLGNQVPFQPQGGLRHFNPEPFPEGERFNIFHLRWCLVSFINMFRVIYQEGLNGVQFVRGQMQANRYVDLAVKALLASAAGTTVIAITAIALAIIAKIVQATARFIGALLYAGYTVVKACFQAIWECCKAVVNLALDVMAFFWSFIKVPVLIVRDGVYFAGSVTYHSVLKPTGSLVGQTGKALGSGMYSAGKTFGNGMYSALITVKDGIKSLAGRVSLFQGNGPNPVNLFPPSETVIP